MGPLQPMMLYKITFNGHDRGLALELLELWGNPFNSLSRGSLTVTKPLRLHP